MTARKIAEIRSRVERVRELLPADLDTFVSERTAAEALILNLFLALQECSDLAMHLVAERGLALPGDVRTAFEVLGKAGILEPRLSRRMAEAVGLPNRIAHEYATLDLGKVFAAARDDVGDLLAFAAAISVANGLDG